MEDILSKFEGKGYGELKKAVIEAVENSIGPVRDKTNELLQNEGYLIEVAHDGMIRAREIASKTLERVYEKIGFLRGM